MTAADRSLNPFPWYRRMRQCQPVSYNWQRGHWNVFRYDDVRRVLSESATFSSHVHRGVSDQLFAGSMVSIDPPRHRHLRALVTQAFTPRAVEALGPRITDIVHSLLDPALASGYMDVVRDLAYPLPAIIMADVMGIPAADRARFTHWSDQVMSVASAHAAVACQEMTAYFRDMIEAHRRESRDDLIGRLLAAREDGEQLSESELLNFCCLLLVSGIETTFHLLGNLVRCLTDHPEVWDRLHSEGPALLAPTIEEVLRYRSQLQCIMRVAAVDTVVGGHPIRQGATVLAWIGSANHDEERFAAPEHFDLARTPNPHLAFGNGIHYCLGAPLARLEAHLVLAALLERVQSVSRVPGVVLEAFPNPIIHGVRRLPVTFTRRSHAALPRLSGPAPATPGAARYSASRSIVG